MQLRAVVLLVALTGCTAAFRTTNGGAMAKPGVSGGVTNSIVFEDRGGPLTRVGFGLLGAAADHTAGDISENSRSEIDGPEPSSTMESPGGIPVTLTAGFGFFF